MARLSSIRTFLVLVSLTLLAVISSFSPTPSFTSNIHRCNNFATTTELGVQIKVVVNDGEPIESALRRFKREINKSGHLMELRHRRYFENSQQKVIRKVKEGRLRKKFERMQRRRMQQRV